jgi:hypothetical protein
MDFLGLKQRSRYFAKFAGIEVPCAQSAALGR